MDHDAIRNEMQAEIERLQELLRGARALDEIAKKNAEIERLRMAIRWALGEQPDSDGKSFAEDRNDRAHGQGRRYWWRSHLRKISGLGDEKKSDT